MRRSSKDQLAEYFRRNLKKGYTPDALKWALIGQGYSRVVVESALDEAQKMIAKEVPPFKEKPKISYQLLDYDDNPVRIKKNWFRKVLGFLFR